MLMGGHFEPAAGVEGTGNGPPQVVWNSYFQRQNIIEWIDVWIDGYQIFDASFVSGKVWQSTFVSILKMT